MKKLTKRQAIQLIHDKPYKLGKMLGFDKLTKMHNTWLIMMIRGKEDQTLQGSRGTYKTTCVSLALAIIMVGLPNLRVLFMRKTDDDVKEVIKQVSNILKSRYIQAISQALWGVKVRLVVENSTELSTNLTKDVKGTNQLVGIGTKASLTGKHYDLIFTDDIVNIQDRISRAERERTKIVYQELQNIKNRGGRIFNTGTPWHKDDCFGIMPDSVKYNCYHEEVKEIITDEDIQKLKSSMTPSLFAANYELRHIAAEDVIFFEPEKHGDPSMVEQGLAQTDAAFGGEDFTAFTIMKKVSGKYYIYGKLWRKHVENCYTEIVSNYNKFMCGKMAIEDNGDKGFTARDLKKLGVRAATYHESMNKYIKITTYLLAIWKDVVFVEGTDEEYIDQICDYNENADHDDAPDSCASLARILYGKKDSNEKYVPLYRR